MNDHNCLPELPRKAHDAQRITCAECGKVWVYTKDEHAGNYWLPFVARNYVKEGEHTKAAISMRRKRHEAQSVYMTPRRKR